MALWHYNPHYHRPTVYRDPFFQDDWDMPLVAFNQMMRSVDPLLRQMNRMVSNVNDPGFIAGDKIVDDKDRFALNVNVSHFSPEEINVKTKDNFLEIEAKHEVGYFFFLFFF